MAPISDNTNASNKGQQLCRNTFICNTTIFNSAIFNAAICNSWCRGGRVQLFPGDPYFPRFTAALGNISSSNKQRRLLADLTAHVHASGLCYADVTQVGSWGGGRPPAKGVAAAARKGGKGGESS